MTQHQQALIQLTAVQAAAKLSAREIAAVEYLEAYIEQIEAVNPNINAVITKNFRRARQEARAAQKTLNRQQTHGALLGLPILVKDNQLTAGIRTTQGSKLYEKHIPSKDAGIINRIRQAGGIIIGKTNIPELSIGANTVNTLFGATCNPYSETLTCGGSSGGSAAAIATNMAVLATGSDHGGSLRIPASFCGVIGYRATPGIVPNEERTINHTNYSLQGPLSRNIADAGLLLSVISQRDRSALDDPMAFPLDSHQFTSLPELDPKQLRIAFSEDLGGLLVSNEVRSLFRHRISQMSGLFKVCHKHPVDLSDAPATDWALRQDVFATQYYDQRIKWGADMNPNVLSTFDAAVKTPLLDIAKARRRQIELYRHFTRIFDEFDLLIIPGVSIKPFPWAQPYPQQIDGRKVTNYMSWLGLSSSLTVVGHPVVAMPCGLDKQGTPFGLQLVGRPFEDARLLSMAQAIETAFSRIPSLTKPLSPYS
ncbi:MAG: amidase [Pseudomonadales bacterium]|jgi:Asp-tRNA(Asn)/Glu-tRNA(Gln) amidotransferase A subunit family amidase|nr:amidase [Pseudomonadales bacterium]